jgi:hypothetical protein
MVYATFKNQEREENRGQQLIEHIKIDNSKIPSNLSQ